MKPDYYDDLADKLDRISVPAVQKSQPLNGKSANDTPTAGLVCAASIKPESINWLWEGWLAAATAAQRCCDELESIRADVDDATDLAERLSRETEEVAHVASRA